MITQKEIEERSINGQMDDEFKSALKKQNEIFEALVDTLDSLFNGGKEVVEFGGLTIRKKNVRKCEKRNKLTNEVERAYNVSDIEVEDEDGNKSTYKSIADQIDSGNAMSFYHLADDLCYDYNLC